VFVNKKTPVLKYREFPKRANHSINSEKQISWNATNDANFRSRTFIICLPGA
jgi:hypothetical protein